MQSLTPLFCKPAHGDQSPILFSKFYPQLNGTIAFRSLNLKSDLRIIHQWVNEPYAMEYWQMDGHFSQLLSIYQCMQYFPFAHSFIGMYNEQLICQLDVYALAVDELKEHIDVQEHDAGFHLLMAPNNNPVHGLTASVINAFKDYFFSFSQARHLYGEPDITNKKSIALLAETGFTPIREIQMSYKKALLHVFKNHQSDAN